MKLRASSVVVTAEATAPRLRAGLSVVNPTVSAELHYIHATAAAVQPAASVACVLPIAALSYIDMAVSMVVDETGRFQYIPDSYAVLDQTFITTAKGFAEAVAIADTQPFFGVDKNLADSISTADAITVVLIFIRSFADSTGVSDAQAFDFLKSLVDTATTTDQLHFAITKLLTDGVGMIDSFDLNDGATYTFTKALSNVSFVTDAFVLTPQKGATDTVTMSSAGSLLSQGYCDVTYFAEDYVGETRTFT